MRRKKLVLPLLALLLAGWLAPAVSQAEPQRRGSSRSGRTIIIRRYYVHPYWYRPYRYDPFYDPYGYNRSYGYREETTGAVEVKVKPDDGPKARLYVNGALADEFKSKEKVKLEPGEYRVEVRKPGYESAARTVYVTAGKTVKLEFHLERAG